jgi:hypothetical protein
LFGKVLPWFADGVTLRRRNISALDTGQIQRLGDVSKRLIIDILVRGRDEQLFRDEIAARRIKLMSELFARRLFYPRRELGLAVHQSVKINGIQY